MFVKKKNITVGERSIQLEHSRQMGTTLQNTKMGVYLGFSRNHIKARMVGTE